MKNKKLLILVAIPFVLTGCKTIKVNDVKQYEKLLKDSRNLDDFGKNVCKFADIFS